MSYFVFRMTVQSYNLMRGDCRGSMTLGENSGEMSRIVGGFIDYEWVMWSFFIFLYRINVDVTEILRNALDDNYR